MLASVAPASSKASARVVGFQACESNTSVRLMSAPALGRPESRAASRSRKAFRDASQESTPKTAAAAMCAQSVAAPPR